MGSTSSIAAENVFVLVAAVGTLVYHQLMFCTNPASGCSLAVSVRQAPEIQDKGTGRPLLERF
jgi:hypothetical protein